MKRNLEHSVQTLQSEKFDSSVLCGVWCLSLEGRDSRSSSSSRTNSCVFTSIELERVYRSGQTYVSWYDVEFCRTSVDPSSSSSSSVYSTLEIRGRWWVWSGMRPVGGGGIAGAWKRLISNKCGMLYLISFRCKKHKFINLVNQTFGSDWSIQDVRLLKAIMRSLNISFP